MHPNWKALSTVDFPRKVFIRPTSENVEKVEEKKVERSNLDGTEVRQFYESVLASEPSTSKFEKKKIVENFDKNNKKKAATKTIRVKSEFRGGKVENSRDLLSLAFSAAHRDNLDALKKIFNDGMVTARDNYGWTLLMVAACENSEQIVKFLLSQHNLDCNSTDKAGNTPISLAEKRGHKNIVKLIQARKTQIAKHDRTWPVRDEPEVASGQFNCEVCGDIFVMRQEWKKHLTSMPHLINQGRKQVEDGGDRAYFVIPEANRGYQMMITSGWDQKKGLGPSGSGKLYPVKTILKRDRQGLGMGDDFGVTPKPKVTHFGANDVSSIKDPESRELRSSTLSKRALEKKLTKSKAREVNFRREFM